MRASRIARIAFTVEDQPYVLPVNCACDEGGNVVFRTGEHSLLSELSSCQVVVEFDGYDMTAREGWCVLVLGRARELTGADDETSRRLLRMDVVPWAPGPRDLWFVVEPQTMSGRRVADPAGAVAGWFPGIPSS